MGGFIVVFGFLVCGLLFVMFLVGVVCSVGCVVVVFLIRLCC